MTCLPISSVYRRHAHRIVLCGFAFAVLQGCATTGEKASAEQAATPVAQSATSPAKAVAARERAPTGAGYSDPTVVSMAGDGPAPAESSSATGSAANLAEAVMQPATINAGRSSIFAQQQELVPAETGASIMTSASLVPAEMPTRRVSPMTGSLFSAPQYASADPAGLPADEQVTSPPLEEEAPAATADAPTTSETEDAAGADPAAPVVNNAPTEPPKKTLFPILGRLLGKAKS